MFSRLMGYSNNGDYERLIEQITDAIVARLNGDGGARIRRRCAVARPSVSIAVPSECIAS